MKSHPLLPLHIVKSPKKSSVTQLRRWFKLNSRTKHLLHCATMLTLIIVSIAKFTQNEHGTSGNSPENQDDIDNNIKNENNNNDNVNTFDPFQVYGTFFASFLYFVRFLALLALPQCCFNFFGLLLYNAFHKRVILKYSPSEAPFICLRTVTRGYYPNLVCENVQQNIKTCSLVGLENFLIEVVTDKSIDGLIQHPRVRQVVVPPDYQTKTGALYKARALQYALEEGINMLKDNDYIVHLDEETLLTENCVRGILNFAADGEHSFGQGLITYANGKVVNWITTLADSFRVADDMGKLRFQFYMFHKPLFGWKGSYVVSKMKAERAVSYDHGLDGSVAEDCFFSMVAFKRGYSFNFIEGEMHEKSPFTIKDLLQQRKRWMQGIYLVVHSPQIPLRNKFLLAISLYSWLTVPLSTSNVVLAMLFPLPDDRFVILNILVAFVGATSLYMFIFGVAKSFSLMRLGYQKFFLCIIGALCVMPFNVMVEIIAVFWGLIGNKYRFYIVQK
ncbi:beta-1,4-mannosyltransferase egh [Brevipalpus obovatus]|uniref:beta-1,4-mannosyltransferase egh n=1 Tax=Brevipalpus obovatus TaxID=246614 RepID=UPI003D9F2EB9